MLRTLLTFSLLTLTVTIAPVLADQSILVDASSAADAALSSLSSLFKATPSQDSHAIPSICCGDSCCPGCCDNHRIIPTDLAYAYPAPTPTPYTQSFDTKRPCCTLGCVDGACRNPTATLSQRPDFTDRPRRGGRAPSTANIVVGCCATCSNCDQAVTSLPLGEQFVAEATATPSVGSPKEKVPLGPGQEAICIGCGKCHPCDNAKIVEYVEFSAHPSDQPEDVAAFASATTDPAPASTVTTTDAAEPTFYLGEDINDAINGQNQDVVPLIVQNGTNSQLLTLLARVEFKVTENYISRRILRQLGLLKKVAPFPKGVEPRIAYLSYHQDKTTIDASIVLDLVAGNPDGGTQRQYDNVRFQVYGQVDDVVIRIPDVIIGEKFLREVGGLTVFPRFKTAVQDGVKVVYPAHPGVLQKGNTASEDEAEIERHDEL